MANAISFQRHKGAPVIMLRPVNLPEVMAQIERLPAEMGRKVLDRVTIGGARFMKPKVLQATPVGITGRLANSIGIKRESSLRTPAGESLARVIARRGKRKGGYYSHLVEFGHVVVVRRNRKTIYRGYYPGKPFMRTAFEANKKLALALMQETARKAAITAANRIGRSQPGRGRALKRGFGLS